MRNVVLALLVLVGGTVRAQEFGRISLTAAVGTGFDMGKPSCRPFVAQIICGCNFGGRFSAGVGTGVALYEKPLIPLFADAKVALCKPGKWTPFVRCGAGYGFALSGRARGGLCIHPAVGISRVLHKRLKLLVQAGCEMQQLERLKGYGNDIISVGFVEKLNHHAISLTVGIEL